MDKKTQARLVGWVLLVIGIINAIYEEHVISTICICCSIFIFINIILVEYTLEQFEDE